MAQSFAMSAPCLQSSAFRGTALPAAPRRAAPVQRRANLQVVSGLKETRDRIASVKNTQKITDAMKLVAAAKVRRAQQAVLNGRPFSEQLVKMLYYLNQRLRVEDVDSPLVQVRPVKTVLLAIVTGDRGLCGGYNNFVIKKAEERYNDLAKMGLKVNMVCIGKKGLQYFKRRPQYNLVANFDLGQLPSVKSAQGVADELYADFVSEEVDKVELVYTKFVSLISTAPIIQTLLPLSPAGEICDIDGTCVDAKDDEIFKLTTIDGKLVVESEKIQYETEDFGDAVTFEQDPVAILDAVLPLYLNATLLRSLQEALASELAARMNAMTSASDNAADLRKRLTRAYNRKRQSMITSQIIEIVSGASALEG